MKPTLSTLVLMLLVSAQAGRTASAETRAGAEVWQANAAAFRGELEALRGPLGIPGLAYVVVRDGTVIAKEGLGRREEGKPEPFTTDTPLRIASVTKALTAILALQQLGTAVNLTYGTVSSSLVSSVS